MLHAVVMNATDLISLAVKICRAKDKARRNELASTCPQHLRNLLRSTVLMVRASQQRKAAMNRNKKRPPDYRHTYKFAPLPESLKTKPKTVLPSVALQNCKDLKNALGGSNV